MVYVITFEAPYSPVWDEGVLHSLVYSAVLAGEEAPVILRSDFEWAEAIYNSGLMELFVDYIQKDFPLTMDMTPFPLQDGLIPHPWDEIFQETMEEKNGNTGLFKPGNSQTD